ncbi:DUF3472 domain-containing protein [Olivibacter sitiensis]|uniref:DUF3472 domain-containing protein n=1 Tax=Olivibacter sitiensis TaxID=376470 RepID=UPI0012FC8AB1|nr:DUF3472 domain-containing protein [Olivibacter sitiensis]
MIKNQLYIIFLMLAIWCSAHAQTTIDTTAAIHVPVAGNTWVVGQEATEGTRRGNPWKDATQWSKTYVRLARQGTLHVWIEAAVDFDAPIEVEVQGDRKRVELRKTSPTKIFLGSWDTVDSGYVSISLRTVDGPVPISQFQSVMLNGEATQGQNHFVASNEDNLFHFGRRGPSVHLKYQIPTENEIVYYYNEVTVPQGEDVVGSYYMANGFGGGYFGMQVNSRSERRVLFSVWSPFQTDRPQDIPEDQRIHLLKKGKEVNTGEFGNEGSGGQSYLKYNWITGNTYKFLLKGEPNRDSTTTYTAWFFAPEENDWRLIASFKRPKTDTYLKGFYSFLENFSPEQGIYTRKVNFGNQWVRDVRGKWHPINKAVFTYDATARKGYRLDYAGGTDGKQFFLQNCGFFNEYTQYGTPLEVPIPIAAPKIDLQQLP